MSRALDALVAERIKGWTWYTRSVYDKRYFGPPDLPENVDPIGGTQRPCDKDNMRRPEEESWWLDDKPLCPGLWVVPHFRTDLNAAVEVQAEMEERGFWLRLESPTSGLDWYARFTPTTHAEDRKNAIARTPAEAIIVAALRAIGVPEAEIRAAREKP